jgi:hypothetical protein
MKKEEIIKRYGEAAYEKQLEQSRTWNKANSERATENRREWIKANPEKFAEQKHELSRKGGKYYQKALMHNRMGLRAARRGIRRTHQNQYRPFKKIISPDSQLHHQWAPGTAEYDGVALVEKEQHQHGIIDVIQILEGEITLLTEKEIRNAR